MMIKWFSATMFWLFYYSNNTGCLLQQYQNIIHETPGQSKYFFG